MSKEAMKLALEALENAWLDASVGKGDVARHTEAITALREALAEQPAQPQQDIKFNEGLHQEREARLTQPQREPVANDWSVFNTGAEVWSGLSLADAVAELTPERMERGWSAVCVINSDNPPIYTSPPAQQQPLTDEQEREAFEAHWYSFYHSGSVSARSDGRYAHPHVQRAWEAWQARAAQE